MSFDMIKIANEQGQVAVDPALVDELKRIVGHQSAFAILEGDNSGVSHTHYRKWLTVLHDIAKKHNVNLNNKAKFEDSAYDIIDHDPYVNTLAGEDETIKQRIVNILWQDHKSVVAHKKLTQHVDNKQQEENEEVPTVKRFVIQRQAPRSSKPEAYFAGIGTDGIMLWTTDPNHAFTYKTNQRANDVITGMLNRDMSKYPSGKQGHIYGETPYQFSIDVIDKRSNQQEENEEHSGKMKGDALSNAALHAASYTHGKTSAKSDYETNKFTSKNPYAPGSFRHDEWVKGYEDHERTVWTDTVVHDNDEPHAETFIRLRQIEDQGRHECEKAHLKGYDSNKPVRQTKCPYSPDSVEHTMWMRGYNQCLGQFADQGY